MQYKSKKMNIDDARKIIEWRNDAPYDIYNFSPDNESLDELLNESFFSIYTGDELVGYYCCGASAQVPAQAVMNIYSDTDYVDIGLGMRPDLTGKGSGKNFFIFILESIKNTFPEKKMRLTVAEFNARAIKVYESTGFKYLTSFTAESSARKFNIMILP